MDKIKHLEELSMLKFSDEEREAFKTEFENILEFVSEITKIDLENTNEKLQGLSLDGFRDDVIQKSMKREDAILNAPESRDGCFVTPMVIE